MVVKPETTEGPTTKTVKPRNPRQFKTPFSDEGRECTSCGSFKPWEDFSVTTKSYTGRTSQCKACKKLGRKPRDIKKEKFSAKANKARLKVSDPCLAKARLIRQSLLNRARKFPEIRQTTPLVADIKVWLESQELVCYYSKLAVSLWDMHIDHKVPPFRGGDNSLGNLCISSAKMNSSKGQMTEEEFLSLIELVSSWEDKGDKLLIRLRQGYM